MDESLVPFFAAFFLSPIPLFLHGFRAARRKPSPPRFLPSPIIPRRRPAPWPHGKESADPLSSPQNPAAPKPLRANAAPPSTPSNTAATPSPSSTSTSTPQPSMRPSCATSAPPNPVPRHLPASVPPLPHLRLNQPQFPPPGGAPSPVISSIPLKTSNLTPKNRFRTNWKRISRLASANRKKTHTFPPNSTPPPKPLSFPRKTRFVPLQNRFVPAISRTPQRLRHRLSSCKSPPRSSLPNPLARAALRHQHPPAAKLYPRLPPVRQRAPCRPPARTGSRHHPHRRAQPQSCPRILQLPPRRSRNETHPVPPALSRNPPLPRPQPCRPGAHEPAPRPLHRQCRLTVILALPPQV